MKLSSYTLDGRRSSLQMATTASLIAWLVTPQSASAALPCCNLNGSQYCTPESYICPDLQDQPSSEECERPPGAGGGSTGHSAHGSGNSGPPRAMRGNACSSCGNSTGMPFFWISEPNVNLRIEDRPWQYSPGRGVPITFQLSYRQRGSLNLDENVFNVGPNWSCSFRAFVFATTNNQTGTVNVTLHRGGAGFVRHLESKAHFWTGQRMTMADFQTCYADNPNGSRDVYSNIKIRCGPVVWNHVYVGWHCGVVAPNGVEYGIGNVEGSSGGLFGGGKAHPYPNEPNPKPGETNPPAKHKDYPVSCACMTCEEVQQAIQDYHDTRKPPPYSATGPNSNTYAHDMLDMIGCSVDPISRSPILRSPKDSGPTERPPITRPPGATGW